MMESYRVGNAGAVKRIGTPHEHDVLSGRGGAINSHIGNTRFREWVRERKNRYNLARTKAEKANVANEVMDLVRNQNPPGRFLQRDQSSVTGGVTWWVEVDEIKAMAKTSQALREGAPSIRAAHKDDLQVKKRTRRPNRKSQATAQKTTPSTTGKRSHQVMQQQPSSFPATTPAPLPALRAPEPTHEAPAPASIVPAPVPVVTFNMSRSDMNQAMQQLKTNVEAARHSDNNIATPSSTLPIYATPTFAPLPPVSTASTVVNTVPSFSFEQPAVKRSRLSENLYLPTAHPQPHIVRPDDETPPLAPLPSPVPLSSIPELHEFFPMPAVPKREPSLRRANSLALSDVGSGNDGDWGDVEFVNPFEGDTSDEINCMPPPYSPPFVDSHCNNNSAPPRNSISNMSVKSELSDLCDVNHPVTLNGIADSEFGEGMKDVYDAVHPGLAAGENEPIPTHLYPFRGSASYDLTKGPPQLIL